MAAAPPPSKDHKLAALKKALNLSKMLPMFFYFVLEAIMAFILFSR